jgi:VWFA-related protein
MPLGRPSSSFPRILWFTLIGAICFFAKLPGARAQKPSPASQVSQARQADASQNTPKADVKTPNGESVSKDTPSKINVSVNLVLVRVVVRNADGKVIPNLKKEDFQVADNHIPQVISSFSVETPASPAADVKMRTSEASSAGTPIKEPDLPQRFVAVLFDDLFLSTGDATYSRRAATKLLESMQTGDRFALFTTSALVEQDFTADRAKLEEALKKTSVQQPELAMANDPDRLRKLFGNLDALSRRMTALPGPRAIVLVSPGFFETLSVHQSGDIIDQAIKADIVINAMDGRGLYGPPGNDDANHPSPGPGQMESGRMGEWLQNDVLGVLADGTGGVFLRDQNDIAQGLPKAVVAVPEVSYVLGFIPQDLKPDGKYHHLKVTLKDNSEWRLQARRGYFAPQGESGIEASAEKKPSGTPGNSGLFPFANLHAPQAPQAGTPQNVPKPDATAPNIDLATLDSPTTFKVRVNVVLVHVVVRDNDGKAIRDLKKEDFRLEDNGKPQMISSFSMETPDSQVSTIKMDTVGASTEETAAKAANMPKRFVALLFDDTFGSSPDARRAAPKLLQAMQPGDRFGVFTTSGSSELGFTTDREKLLEAISKTAVPRPELLHGKDYEYLLRQLNRNFRALIRKMSTLPGPRTIVLVSQGYHETESVHESGDMIDLANKAKIAINAIDARGLYGSAAYDVSSNGPLTPKQAQSIRMREWTQNDVLEQLADGTGGTFFHDRNDLDQGLLNAGAMPEFSYVLGFTPESLKLDGKYHQLKVTLTTKKKWAVQARHGYFAPLGGPNRVATAREETAGLPSGLEQTPPAPAPVPQAPQADASQNAAKQEAKTPTEVVDSRETPHEEVSSHDTPATFKLHVNLVLVRVVVRDNNGKVITGLKKEDFQVADNRKPQMISSFSVETPASHVPSVKMEASEASSEGKPVKALELPQRFVTLFFDDVHLSIADSMYSQRAAAKVLESMQEGDRFAIFTTSGAVMQDFTADRAKLDEAIKRIIARGQDTTTDCPPMSFYEAYQIIEINDPFALQVAVEDVVQCMNGARGPELIAKMAAQRELGIGEYQVRQAFGALDGVIRRMSALPGQRAIVLVSPGFFVSPSVHESGDVIDRATKANVVINAIDARGLYVYSYNDASNRFTPSNNKMQFVMAEESIQNAVLEEVADGTGGLFFHNRNDIEQGIRQAAAAPEVSYLLGFTPQNLKLDGKYHQLKVTLANKQKWALQARHGYFAPQGEAAPDKVAKQEIEEAVFSQAEMQDLPMQCQTQFFSGADGAHLTVLARIATNTLGFRRVEDRNNDSLTLVTAIFDDNGNMLKGEQKVIELRLRDSTRERFNKEGLKFKSSFDLKPGTYLVRIVVRDSEGAQMAALNRGVVIP